jgi:hypothetical protein
MSRDITTYKNNMKKSVIMDNYKESYAAEYMCIALIVLSLVVAVGVAWAVN